jgi:alanine racemase
MNIQRATFAEIHLDAFRRNLGLVRTALGGKAKILAVVKADAYGHGAVPCARAALESGADQLGVGIIEEGIELRQHGITAPVLVLDSIFPNEIRDLIAHNLSVVVTTPSLATALSQEAAKTDGKIVGLHIKIDTGMGRLGVLPDDFLPLLEHIRKCKNLVIEGVSTHFSSADDPDPDYTLKQLSRFNAILEAAKKAGASLPPAHCANSSALIKFPQTWLDLVRPGLILYGALPSPALQPYAQRLFGNNNPLLLPVMHWKTRILQINRLPKGAFLSYGNTYRMTRDGRIATLPIGYADGLSRRLSGKMQVLVHGRRSPQRGTICMDMCLVDVSHIPAAEVGDEVVIFGAQGGQTLTVEEVAAWGETIPYEILCGVSKRVPRLHIS